MLLQWVNLYVSDFFALYEILETNNGESQVPCDLSASDAIIITEENQVSKDAEFSENSCTG